MKGNNRNANVIVFVERGNNETYSNRDWWGIVVVFNCRKHRLRSKPFHSWTPMIPKIKNTKKQSNKTLPNIGKVSSSNITRILIDGTRLIARRGRRTRTVRIADKLKLSPGRIDSTSLNREQSTSNSTENDAREDLYLKLLCFVDCLFSLSFVIDWSWSKKIAWSNWIDWFVCVSKVSSHRKELTTMIEHDDVKCLPAIRSNDDQIFLANHLFLA